MKNNEKINHDDRGEYLNVCVLKPPRELLCQLHLLHDLHRTQHLQTINWIKLSTASLMGNCWYLEQFTHTKNTILLTGLFCGGTFDVGSHIHNSQPRTFYVVQAVLKFPTILLPLFLSAGVIGINYHAIVCLDLKKKTLKTNTHIDTGRGWGTEGKRERSREGDRLTDRQKEQQLNFHNSRDSLAFISQRQSYSLADPNRLSHLFLKICII